MSGFGRITQATLEVLASTTSHARITQLYAEVLAPLHSTARQTQLYAEVLAPEMPADARMTQLTLEVLGPPRVTDTLARVTQLYAEILGAPINETPCELPADLVFYGNVTGQFYKMESVGAESVPVALADDYVTIAYGSNVTPSQELTIEETWFEWSPEAGALEVKFASGNPVRTIWIITNQSRANPPVIPVWASAFRFDLWKQECTPS